MLGVNNSRLLPIYLSNGIYYLIVRRSGRDDIPLALPLDDRFQRMVADMKRQLEAEFHVMSLTSRSSHILYCTFAGFSLIQQPWVPNVLGSSAGIRLYLHRQPI